MKTIKEDWPMWVMSLWFGIWLAELGIQITDWRFYAIFLPIVILVSVGRNSVKN